MEELSLKIFGTTDYQSVLNVLAPSDKLVKEFKKQCKLQGYMND